MINIVKILESFKIIFMDLCMKIKLINRKYSKKIQALKYILNGRGFT